MTDAPPPAPTPTPPPEPRAPEPAFNAPPAALLIVASIPLSYWLQTQLEAFDPTLALRYALVPAAFWAGEGGTGAFTSIFLHADWLHAGANTAAALAFAAGPARLLKGRGGGALLVAFYLACGVSAAIGYALLHPDSRGYLVGASGAVFGLAGATLRLSGRRRLTLTPLTSRRFLAAATAMMAANVALGLLPAFTGFGVDSIAWEAHAVGFLAGALLIGPLARLVRRPARFASGEDSGDLDI